MGFVSRWKDRREGRVLVDKVFKDSLMEVWEFAKEAEAALDAGDEERFAKAAGHAIGGLNDFDIAVENAKSIGWRPPSQMIDVRNSIRDMLWEMT